MQRKTILNSFYGHRWLWQLMDWLKNWPCSNWKIKWYSSTWAWFCFFSCRSAFTPMIHLHPTKATKGQARNFIEKFLALFSCVLLNWNPQFLKVTMHWTKNRKKKKVCNKFLEYEWVLSQSIKQNQGFLLGLWLFLLPLGICEDKMRKKKSVTKKNVQKYQI